MTAPYNIKSEMIILSIKDTHKENAPSNKTQAPTKSVNMNILVVGALNQLFVRSSYTEKFFEKIFVIGPFRTPSSICLNTGFCDRAVLYGNVAFLILVVSTKKPYSSFLKKGFIFHKTAFQS